MNWRLFLFLFLFMGLFFVHEGFGQIIPEKTKYQRSTQELWGRISDTTRIGAVPLAHVFLMHGKDTTKLVADLTGRFYYTGQLSDTMRVQVTAIGFKPFSGLYIPKRHGLDICIQLQQDAVELDEVIITGKRLLMIVKGDTLQYNTDEVKTLDGAKLGDVLKKLPGVSMDGTLKVNGLPIHRIYVNGDTLFKGLDALDHIEADNVKDVKVFNERNKEDLAQGLRHGRREKVMDVTTKREVTQKDIAKTVAFIERRNSFQLGGGMDASQDRTSKFPEKFLIKYNYQKGNAFSNKGIRKGESVSERQGIRFSFDYSNLFLKDKREFGGEFSYAKKYGKFSYRSTYIYRNTTTYDNKWEEQDYFPTEQFNSRRYEKNVSEKNTVYKYTTSQSLGFYLKKINFQLNGHYSYGADKNWNNNWMLSTLDNEVINGADVRDYNREHTSQGDMKFQLSTDPKKKTTFALFSALDFKRGGRKGWQIDTLETSSRHIYLNRDWDNNVIGWNMNAQFSSVISPLFKLFLTGNHSYDERGSKGLGENRLTGLLDTNNTRNYTWYTNSYSIDGILVYYGNQCEISGGGTVMHQRRNQVERFPIWEQTKDRFLFFEPKLKLTVEFSSTFNLSADYSSQTNLPTAEQLRTEINDANPLYLSGGNPNLKSTKKHNWIILFNKMILPSSAFRMEIYFNLIQDPIVSNSRYFTERTYLKEYDYTVEQGATLNTYKNSDPGYDLEVKVGYDKFWSFLGRCVFETKYHRMKEPSFSQGERNDLTTDAGEFRAIITFNSRKIGGVLSTTTMFSHSESRLGGANETFKESVYLRGLTGIIPKFKVETEVKFDYEKNLTTRYETNNMILNASISRDFGKYFSMKLQGQNLLDANKSKSLNRTAEYYSRREFTQTGRYVGLILSCKF